MKFHGSDVTSLHKFVDPAILPTDLGGSQEPDIHWFFDSLYLNHDKYVKRGLLMKAKLLKLRE